jgi:hypothetical protein
MTELEDRALGEFKATIARAVEDFQASASAVLMGVTVELQDATRMEDPRPRFVVSRVKAHVVWASGSRLPALGGAST